MSEQNIKSELFGDLDFSAIAADASFKEDSVRERIILPILHKLGYEGDAIVRSMTLKHSFLKVGSSKRKITLVPDYVLRIGQFFPWVLDAKAPDQKIVNDDNVEQVYSYAIHPEIRSVFFALCNGVEFAVYKTSGTDTPVLFFKLEEIDKWWTVLAHFLSPSSFTKTREQVYEPYTIAKEAEEFVYASRNILSALKKVQKQSAKRYFGCTAYFTRQSWDVVQSHIKNFTQEGDVVLDPFGGSGVTAIESLMTRRYGIHVDLNPLSVFMTDAITASVNTNDLWLAFDKIKKAYEKDEPKTKKAIKEALAKYPQPKDLPLPKGSDVETVWQLFSDEQRAQLSFLKYLIKKQKDKNLQKSLMLAFYNTITMCNLSFHSTRSRTGNAGVCGIVAYYRYRIAPDPTFVDVIETFERKVKRIINGKKEMAYYINENTIGNLRIYKGDATDLHCIEDESVDYIYTDPPYGAKIQYLDLSTMWNAWLDLEVSEEDFEREAIEGGEHNKTKDDYKNLIAKSIKEMYRVLKYNRWLSFVFSHKNPEYWHMIIDAAEDSGFEYIGTVTQNNGQASFKKVQNPFSVLSSEMIINFRKSPDPTFLMRANLGMNITDVIMQTAEGIIAKNNGATVDEIYDQLVNVGIELGILDLLAKDYKDMTPIFNTRFDYDAATQKYLIRPNTSFVSHVDVKLRARYYIVGKLRRCVRENRDPDFDEIVTYVLPLLKNGTTPEAQTVLSVLKDVANETPDGCWRLKSEDGQGTLF